MSNKDELVLNKNLPHKVNRGGNMDYYKFNLFYNDEGTDFEELMTKIFTNYFKQQIESESLQKC